MIVTVFRSRVRPENAAEYKPLKSNSFKMEGR